MSVLLSYGYTNIHIFLIKYASITNEMWRVLHSFTINNSLQWFFNDWIVKCQFYKSPYSKNYGYLWF